VKIAWYSNSPKAATGYGTQTRQMLSRIKADGHDICVLGLWGHNSGIEAFDTPSGPVPLWPSGSMHYGLDVVDAQARAWFGDDPGWVITLYDVWVLKNIWKGLNIASWTPIDHDPVTPSVAAWAKTHPTIAMSRFGQKALGAAGIDSVYIPHGIERVYRPTPSDVRERLGVPDDAFLVMMNAANTKAPHVDRKAWQVNLRAFAMFAREHPDAVIYLHTDPTRPDGFPLASYLSYLGLDEKQTRITDLLSYRAGLIDNEEMARLYTASDVLLSCSMGEGFGLAVPEAMACGTPAIVTDFTAQPELVGDAGWRVGWEPFWDEMQRSDFAFPSVVETLDALEEAYAERGTAKARERSEAGRAHIVAEYDADTVYAERWRPFLAAMESQLGAKEATPQQKPVRKGQSKGSKKRRK
jgi:glycosyltransferase involved in cell wall biosynthesis